MALIARRIRDEGGRLLVVNADTAALDSISKALWTIFPDAFLAHGLSGQGNEARQPVLLSSGIDRENQATNIILADGQWRKEALAFERSFLLFDDDTLQAARAAWAGLKTSRQERSPDSGQDHDPDLANLALSYFAQENGRWVQKAQG